MMRAVLAVAVAAAIFFGCAFAVEAFGLPTAVHEQIALKLALIAAAIAAGVASRRSLADLGFRRGEKAPWAMLGFGAVIIGAATSATIIGLHLPPNPMLADFSPLAFLLVIVLLSSISEEVLCRGYLQAELERALRGAAPVLISGLFFGAMHLTLARTLVLPTFLVTLTFVTLLGLLAATARARTHGLVAPIVVHMLGNVGGMIGAILVTVAARLATH
jgi:membrane protease YdiL (CAAX protease family)